MRDFPASDQIKLFSNLIAQFVGRAYAQDSLYMQLANTRFGHARDFTDLFHCQFLKDYLAEPGAILVLDG